MDIKRNKNWSKALLFIFAFSVIGLGIIFALADMQSVASYKDSIISKWDTYWTKEKAFEQESITEQKTKEVQTQAELNWGYAQLFNDFRTQNGKTPLTFDSRLNELARQRVIEITQPGNFNHEGIKKYNLGENIVVMAYSADSNSRLLEQWASSPGHRSNILSSMYTRTGFARIGRYAVQIFD